MALVSLKGCQLKVVYFLSGVFSRKNNPFFSDKSQNVNGMTVMALVLLKECQLKVKCSYIGFCFFTIKSSFLHWHKSKCQWNECCGASVAVRVSAESQILLSGVF
jgi:hypothetical protein